MVASLFISAWAESFSSFSISVLKKTDKLASIWTLMQFSATEIKILPFLLCPQKVNGFLFQQFLLTPLWLPCLSSKFWEFHPLHSYPRCFHSLAFLDHQHSFESILMRKIDQIFFKKINKLVNYQQTSWIWLNMLVILEISCLHSVSLSCKVFCTSLSFLLCSYLALCNSLGQSKESKRLR